LCPFFLLRKPIPRSFFDAPPTSRRALSSCAPPFFFPPPWWLLRTVSPVRGVVCFRLTFACVNPMTHSLFLLRSIPFLRSFFCPSALSPRFLSPSSFDFFPQLPNHSATPPLPFAGIFLGSPHSRFRPSCACGECPFPCFVPTTPFGPLGIVHSSPLSDWTFCFSSCHRYVIFRSHVFPQLSCDSHSPLPPS